LHAANVKPKVNWSVLYQLEDWWANWLGAGLLLLAANRVISTVPKIAKWQSSLSQALPISDIIPLLSMGLIIGLVAAFALKIMDKDARGFLIGYPFVFLLAVAAYIIGAQETLSLYGFNYVIWALILGMAITNIFGHITWLQSALKAEMFIKTGLVLMGAEILFNRVMALGVYGLGVAWLVTPIVLYVMYWLGTRLLKIQSKSLVATIAATTSVCGVSAAIATGAATKARKEEVSFAISISLIFTILMMLGLPPLIRVMGLGEVVGGAWIGGTVDSTGAVVAAGAMLGKTATEVAALVKMLQNALIGLVSFGLAVIWVSRVERKPGESRPSPLEIWVRFPKFIIGFMLASALFSFILIPGLGDKAVNDIIKVTTVLRNWLFCIAFVSIGLDTNFAEMKRLAGDHRPVMLYILGQTFNLVLTLAAAWFFFSGHFFPPIR